MCPTQTHEHCGLNPFWHFLDLALTDRVIFMPYRRIMLSEASFKTPAVLLIVVLLSPIQTTAINSSLHNRCVFVSETQYSYYLSADTSLNTVYC